MNQAIRLQSRVLFFLCLTFVMFSYVCAQPSTPAPTSQTDRNQSTVKTHEKQPLEGVPLPKRRGFWGMFFFWGGGVLCMYWVGRRVFREQSHERLTLRRFRDEIGHFFPEFDPSNISKWVNIAAEHLYSSWRSGSWDTMKSFTTDEFIETQQSISQDLISDGLQREAYLGKVLNVHLLGAYMQEGCDIPPLGVELMCRIELKVIDFKKKNDQDETILGIKKPRQEQQIWTLRHTGHTWSLHRVEVATSEITHLKDYDPLPEMMAWKKSPSNHS